MAQQTDAYLKGRFITGATPTESDFGDLIDSKRNIADDLAISDVTGLQTALDNASGGSTTWGGITGTLSSQTDLNTALNGKAATSHTHSGATPSVAGFMSAADKVKLNGLDSTNYAPTSHEHVKADITDLASSELVPSGGTDGQVLSKVSGSVAWADASGGGGDVWTVIDEIDATTTLTLYETTDLSSFNYRSVKIEVFGPSLLETLSLKINGVTSAGFTAIERNKITTNGVSSTSITSGMTLISTPERICYGVFYITWYEAEPNASELGIGGWAFGRNNDYLAFSGRVKEFSGSTFDEKLTAIGLTLQCDAVTSNKYTETCKVIISAL